jgi:hypothetical protein
MWLKVKDVPGQNGRVMNLNIFQLREILFPLMVQDGKNVASQLFSQRNLNLPVAFTVVSQHIAEKTETCTMS